MFESLLEVGYEAELSTAEHPELLELAPEMCNEHPETRAAAIQELRDMIYERGECRPRRTDDAFLLRFLRKRRFVVPRAHRQLVRYCRFLETYPELYKDVDLWKLARLGAAFESSMVDHPDVGRLIIIRFGKWNLDEYPAVDMIRTGMLLLEIGLRAPKAQVMGITAIVDMAGVSVKQVVQFTPTIAHQIACLVGEFRTFLRNRADRLEAAAGPVAQSDAGIDSKKAMVTTSETIKLAEPLIGRACHFINYNWLLTTALFVSRRFMDKNAMNRLYFHGHDVKSLHQYIDPGHLPARYGGTCRNHFNITTWLNKIKKYRDEEFDREMKDIGYAIKS